MKTGIHIIGDLYDCQFSKHLEKKSSVKKLEKLISSKVRECELTELGNFYHYFGSYALTAVICLSESHISFHTWPESNYTSLDVFVCNFKKNNTKKAEIIFNWLVEEIFRPKTKKVRKIKR